MNIQMQLCGLLILLLLLYFYKRHDTVGLFTEKLFQRAIYVNVVGLALDILSVFLIVNMDKLPELLVKTECKLYLISLVWMGYMALAYASADAYKLSDSKRFIRLFSLVVIADSLIILCVPVYIFHEGSIVYTYGPACIATYIGALAFILVILFRISRKGLIVNPKRRTAMRTWMIIWILAAVIQFVHNQFLVVGFASAMGMVILFFELENPESNLDRETGFFNARIFVDYLKQRYSERVDKCGFLVSLEDAHMRELQPEYVEEIMYQVTSFLRRVPEARIFKTDEAEYTLLFDDKEKMDRALSMITERFRQEWLEEKNNMDAIIIEPYYVIAPSGEVAKSAEEMLSLLKYFRAHVMDNPENRSIIVDEASVAKKRAREEMLRIIIAAMAEDRVEVFFQPIYSIEQKRFVSAEALVRIRNEDGSILPPGLFIPVAEQTGLIEKIGERVFEKTCQFIKENPLVQYGVEYIEVNLSVVQCENRALAKMYIDIMDKYQIDPSFINLEITESASIIMKKTLLDNMKALIDYGVSFSLDDFGNGESNLNYIVDMPVHIVKFDKDMTQAYFENEKAKYVLQAATDMIQGLALKVVAEGVETAEQLRAFERLGIDYIQGYYFSKPIDAKKYIEFLKTKNA